MGAGARTCLVCLRTSVYDLLVHIGILLSEVVLEHLSKLVSLCIVSSLVSPCITRIEDLSRNIRLRDSLGDLEVESCIVNKLNIVLVECVVESSCYHSSCELELHSGACAVRAAGPACVYEIYLCVVLLDLLAQHLSILLCRQRHERLAEQCGECGCRLCDADLCTSYLGGEAGNELIHSSFLGKTADRRQNAEGVSCQEDDNCGDTANAGNCCIGDVLDRIADSGVLSKSSVVIVRLSCIGVDNNVLYERTELDSIVDLGLALSAEVDALSIAAALDVEHAVLRPAVLVVADEESVRISGKCGLTCSGKAEEYCCVLSNRVCIGGGVHRKNTLERQIVVHSGEHGLLDLARIAGAADNCALGLIVEKDSSLRTCAVYLGNALEAGSCDNGEERIAVISELLLCRSDKQISDEEVLACQLVNYSELLCIFGISACKSIEHIDISVLQISDHLSLDSLESLSCDRSVYITPVYIVMCLTVINDELILCRTACILAGLNYESACVAELSLALDDSVLCKNSR